MRLINDPVMVSLDASVAQASVAIDASQLFDASVQGVATGAPSGTLKLQASNDKGQTPTNWSDIAQVAIAAAGVFLIPKLDIAYNFVRVTWVQGGTGTISANFHGKGF